MIYDETLPGKRDFRNLQVYTVQGVEKVTFTRPKREEKNKETVRTGVAACRLQ